ncbi:hypothetical protein VitviT2T_030204 [Vitis vinifera]|uniref:Ankyrin repeat-containing protein n=1 Tax=Vitis vinifera TaxID=29760 RepID=A0ABY9E0F9_VITVI|nr:hypothetical protein VitviT2T_030204 [Vitis vinifera]
MTAQTILTVASSSTSSLKRTTTIDTAHLTNNCSSSEFYYLELYKAVLNGDWESASKLLKDDPRSFSAPIRTDDSRMLHIAVELGEARMGFVEKLVEFLPSEALALRDSDGVTALFNAARAGNIKAVKLLVNKNPSLPNICQRDNFAPLHSAVSANSPTNSNMDIAEHDEEFTVMASSSLPLSVIDDSPNNPNCSSINMAQDTDEYGPVSSTSSLKRTTTIDTAHHTNEYVSVVSSSSLRRTSSSGEMLKTMFMPISV